MAKSQSPYKDIVAEIRKKQFAPIYVLMGEEPYFIDEITELLQKLVISEDEKDFNYTSLYGADSNIEMVINAARRYPVMAERQLVILKEAQTLHDSKNQLEKLTAYATHPVKSTVLVVVYKGEPLKSTSKFIKETVKNGGVVYESAKVKDYQLDAIIKDYCSGKKIAIDDKSRVLLKDYIGTDLKRMFSEIDKLIVAIGDKTKSITPEAIERNIGISKDFNNFELIKALATRNYAKALQIIDYFENNPKQNPTILTVTLMFNFFSNLLLAYFSSDKTEQGLMNQLRLKSSYQLIDIKTALPNYNYMVCMRILSAIREFDAKSKGIGSMQKEYPLLKELIFKVFTA